MKGYKQDKIGLELSRARDEAEVTETQDDENLHMNFSYVEA